MGGNPWNYAMTRPHPTTVRLIPEWKERVLSVMLSYWKSYMQFHPLSSGQKMETKPGKRQTHDVAINLRDLRDFGFGEHWG